MEQASERSESIRRGRVYIAVVIGFHALLAIGVVILAIVMQRHDQLVRQLLKLAGNISLMYGLWMGSAWIRWLYAFGLTITCIGAAIVPLVAPKAIPPIIGYPLSAFSTFGMWALVFSSSGNDFFRWRKGEIDL